MYSPAELSLLAVRYLGAHPEIAVSTLGKRAARNPKLFGRLRDGQDCTGRSALRASLWFDRHWPAGLPWPLAIERGLVARRERVAQRALRPDSRPCTTPRAPPGLCGEVSHLGEPPPG